MDTSAHADAPARLQDALKQRYYLPRSDDSTASPTQRKGLYALEAHHGLANVMDLPATVVLSPSIAPANTEAIMFDTQEGNLAIHSADSAVVASPPAIDSTALETAPPEVKTRSSVLPSKVILDRAANLTVNDARGQAVPFKELYRTEPGQRRRVMIIFIRHFFCGNCQEFLRTLISQIPPTSLPANTSIAFIGCGSHTLIQSYTELTSCPYPIYADPTKRLFDVLGMQRSLSLGWNAPDYIQHTLAAGAMKSIVQGMKRIPAGDVTKAGDLSQNGGEYLFETEGADTRSKTQKPDNESKGNAGLKVKVTFCHRMRNTRDHTEMPELVRLLGSSEADERVYRPISRIERRWTSGGTIGNLARSLSNKRQNWLERRSSSSWSRTKRRDRSESSSRGDRGRRRSPDRFETVREDLRSRDGQRPAEDTAKIDGATPAAVEEVKAGVQRFSFDEREVVEV